MLRRSEFHMCQCVSTSPGRTIMPRPSSSVARGTAGLPYIIALERGEPAIRGITFCGPAAEIGGEREVNGPEGEIYRFVLEKSVAPLPASRDEPIQLSHVVLNSKDVDDAERFA